MSYKIAKKRGLTCCIRKVKVLQANLASVLPAIYADVTRATEPDVKQRTKEMPPPQDGPPSHNTGMLVREARTSDLEEGVTIPIHKKGNTKRSRKFLADQSLALLV